ncbi:MAG: hypothetical protein ACR2NZ_22165 [Rubripirellula sp.]
MTNPYEPSSVTSELTTASPPSRSPISLLPFLPGCVLGLQIGSVLELGFTSTIQRTTTGPANAFKFFAIFSLVCLAITFVYRIPRARLIGTHRIHWFTSFASGTLMTLILYGGVYVIDRGGLAAGSPRQLLWLLLVLSGSVSVSVVLAVELEALIDRFLRRRGSERD